MSSSTPDYVPPPAGWAPPPGQPPPPGWAPSPYPAYAGHRDEPTRPVIEQVTFVLLAIAVGIVLGVAGGYLWSVVSDPPLGIVTDQGVFLVEEAAYDQQSTMTLWFLVTGAGLGLLGGLLAGWRGARYGVTSVIAVLALSAVAAAVAAWTGIHLFGPDFDAARDAAANGESVTTALDVGSFVAYLGWPIGGLVGVLGAVATLPHGRAKRPTSPWP